MSGATPDAGANGRGGPMQRHTLNLLGTLAVLALAGCVMEEPVSPVPSAPPPSPPPAAPRLPSVEPVIIPETDSAETITLPNPAGFCTESGGRYETRTGPDGAQTAICILASGEEVDAWQNFRDNALTQ